MRAKPNGPRGLRFTGFFGVALAIAWVGIVPIAQGYPYYNESGPSYGCDDETGTCSDTSQCNDCHVTLNGGGADCTAVDGLSRGCLTAPGRLYGQNGWTAAFQASDYDLDGLSALVELPGSRSAAFPEGAIAACDETACANNYGNGWSACSNNVQCLSLRLSYYSSRAAATLYYYGFLWQCDDGFDLDLTSSTAGGTCIDINECGTASTCGQDLSTLNSCSNSVGGYSCSCGAGFEVSGSGLSATCVASAPAVPTLSARGTFALVLMLAGVVAAATLYRRRAELR